jgi:hypothetical protein
VSLKILFDARWSTRKVKIENAFGILKTEFQILHNRNVDLKCALTIVIVCYLFHNFLIEEGDIGRDDKDENLIQQFL